MPKKLIIARDVHQAECPCLDRPLTAGTVVWEYTGTDGCVGPGGVAVTWRAYDATFFEIPRAALEGPYTIYASPDVKIDAEKCYSDREWNDLLRAGIAAWDLSNARDVDPVLIGMIDEGAKQEAIDESVRRRREWTASLRHRIENAGCKVEVVDGVANISFSDASPAWCRAYAKEKGIAASACSTTTSANVAPGAGFPSTRRSAPRSGGGRSRSSARPGSSSAATTLTRTPVLRA